MGKYKTLRKEKLTSKDRKYFLKYQKKLAVAAKLGDKDPDMNPKIKICNSSSEIGKYAKR